MALIQTASSRQYVPVRLESVTSPITGEPVEPTMLRMAILPADLAAPPATTVWRPTLHDETTGRVVSLRAADSLPPGTYAVWLEVTAGDERVEVNTGVLVLT